MFIYAQTTSACHLFLYIYTQSLPSAKVKPPIRRLPRKIQARQLIARCLSACIDFGKVPEADKKCEVLVNSNTSIYSFLSFPYMETVVSSFGNCRFLLWEQQFLRKETIITTDYQPLYYQYKPLNIHRFRCHRCATGLNCVEVIVHSQENGTIQKNTNEAVRVAITKAI